MSAPLLSTKLHVPPIRPQLVPRPRLVKRLTAGLGKKLTLISASAGFGKTTLAVEWLARAGRPFTWLSLDEGDNDPARFLRYLVAALQRIDAAIGQSAPGLLKSSVVPAAELAMTTIINDIGATAERFTLVLDDLHAIQADWIHAAITFLILHQPPSLHLVLICRADAPLPMPRLRVRDQVNEIRADDLRFTTAESAAFLNQTVGREVGSEVVEALENRTEGWIAGLQLASLALQTSSSRQGSAGESDAEFIASFRGSHRHVIDYLSDEVLAQQPDEIRSFLRRTSILDRMTAALCDAVTGREDSETLLRELDQANLFLNRLDEQRIWYRYHALFADFLRTDLERTERAALHLRAARWFAGEDLLPEAVEHALASGDVQEAAHMIARAAEEALRTAAFATLAGWLDALPEDLVQTNSELSICKGFLLFLTDRRDEATAYAEAADKSLPQDASAGSRGRLLSLKAQVAQCAGDIGVTIELSRHALDCLDKDDAIFRDLAQNLLGQSLELQGNLTEAAAVYERAFISSRQSGGDLGTLVVLTNLAFALNELGQRRRAIELCREVVGVRTSQPSRSLSLTDGAYLAWSLLSLEANELELAREQVKRALLICTQGDVVSGVLWGQFILARVHLAYGDIEALREICQQGYRLAVKSGREGLQGAWFLAAEAQATLQQGDIATATAWATTANVHPRGALQPWSEFSHFVYTRVLLAQSRIDEAKELLDAMAEQARHREQSRSLITIYLLRARVEIALGHDDQALAHVEQALRLASPQGYRRAFLDEGEPIAAMLERNRHVAPNFVSSLVADTPAERVTSGGRGVPSFALTEPLTSREREILRLIAAGRSNPEIASLLYLSLNTVKWHASNLYGKLGVSNRVEAVTRARDLNLL